MPFCGWLGKTSLDLVLATDVLIVLGAFCAGLSFLVCLCVLAVCALRMTRWPRCDAPHEPSTSPRRALSHDGPGWSPHPPPWRCRQHVAGLPECHQLAAGVCVEGRQNKLRAAHSLPDCAWCNHTSQPALMAQLVHRVCLLVNAVNICAFPAYVHSP